ncbi:electron transport complex subunit RsxC [Anaeroglobus geminatus]|uniref:Ion-translocating oxidoreductase complex subunit C n=1 Tax=Anaeroglobus geminatus F0357 TaxID=861450 RepID=G9YGY0_9FIRM|nr:electron transport complex subunit RsxC [Anaeroglobus geminatus]EHM41678.1 electron transport complex, RnfABCDGE type, C subunit [Anaeroglobus geminatus F0357]
MMKSFIGGVHPDDGKAYAKDKAIETPAIPDEVVIPMSQHFGAPCTPTVKVGDHVKKGQLIGTSDAFLHADIHASTSGEVVKVAPMPHNMMVTCMSVVIKADGLDEWADGLPDEKDWRQLDKTEIVERIKKGGVVGCGGATFPAHVKLTPNKPVDTFIVNAAECEPYLTCDYRLMLEQAEKLVTGVQICMKALGVDKGYIGIEDNKPEAVKVLTEAFASVPEVTVEALPTKYPQGAEKMLIKAVTDREVEPGGLPMDVGCVVSNVGTVIAITDAVCHGIPFIERVTTVTGDCIKEPKNLSLRIGTPFQYAIDYCGGFSSQPDRVIAGGPMMGLAQFQLDVPVAKGVSGILALSPEKCQVGVEDPCIRRGRCVDACPMGLIPSQLSIFSSCEAWDKCMEYGVMNCVECGSCVYVCPAKRNIVQYIRNAKAQVKAQQQAAKAKAEAK